LYELYLPPLIKILTWITKMENIFFFI
jgi:hypothetical protein